MVLKLRIADRCLRSVDATPGVVGASVGPDGPCFTVDSNYEPSPLATALGAAVVAAGGGGTISERGTHDGPNLPDHVTPIDVSDAVEACETVDELRGLFGIGASLLPDVVGICGPHLHYEGIIACCEWLIDVRVQVSTRIAELEP